MKNKHAKHLARGIAISVFITGFYCTSAQVSYTAKYNKKEFVFTVETGADGKTYQAISSKKLSCTDEPGKPVMPVQCIRLLIPEGQIVDSVVLTSTTKESIGLEYKVMPAQVKNPLGLKPDTQEFTLPDPVVYNSESVYPATIVKIAGDEYFDGNNHVVILEINPFQYHPVKNTIEFHPDVSFMVKYQPVASAKRFGKAKEIKPIKRNQRNQDVYTDLLKRLVDNPEAVKTKSVSEIKSVSRLKSGTSWDWSVPCYEYEVITTAALAPAFTELVSWKKRKGYDAGIVTIEAIMQDANNNVNHNHDPVNSRLTDNEGKLRNYLKAAWENGTMYVLLGGDYTTSIPIRYGSGNRHDTWSTATGNNPSIWVGGWNTRLFDHDLDAKIPSDLYFADFQGDWDVDGVTDVNYVYNTSNENYYGEDSYGGDNVNYFPEIFIGRLLCRTQEEIINWTKKLLKYEQNPGNGNPTYLTKVLFSEADGLLVEGSSSTEGGTAPELKASLSFLNTPYIIKEDTDAPTGASTISELNNHYGLYSNFCHGSPNSFAVRTAGDNQGYGENGVGTDRYQVTSSDDYVSPNTITPENGNGFDNLTNVNYPFLIYSMSCLNVPFDNYLIGNPNQRCLGAAFTLLPNVGGPAYVGNTRYGWGITSIALFTKFANELSSGNTHIGQAEAISKSNLPRLNTLNHWIALTHNLIGCPEMPMWTAVPMQFNNPTIYESGYDMVTVTAGIVDSQWGNPSANVTIMSAIDNGQTYHSTQGTYGNTPLTFYGVVKPYYVTITRKNYIPYLSSLTNVYIQNKKLNIVNYLNCQTLSAGYFVDPSQPNNKGNVVIQSGASVTFDATGVITLAPGFEVELGATFEAK